MKRFLAWALICFGLPVGLPSHARDSLPDGPLSAEVHSWGPIWIAWSITPGGEVSHTERQSADGEQYEGAGRYWLVTRRAQVAPDSYRRIRTMMASAEALSDGDWKCQPGMTDGPYGWAQWGEGPSARRLDYQTICMSNATKVIGIAINAADEQIKAWTKDGNVVSRVWMGPPGDEPKGGVKGK